MKVVGDLAHDVCRYASVDPTSNTEVVGVAISGINEAIDRLNSKTWTWTQATSGFALTETPSYPLPTDFKSPRNLVLLNTDGRPGHPVNFYDSAVFERTYAEQGTDSGGTPDGYTIYNPYPAVSGEITFDQTPNASTIATYPSGRMLYYKYVPNAWVATDEIDLPPGAMSYITWYGRFHVASIYSTAEKIQISASQVAYTWDSLTKEENRNKTADQLRRRR